MNRPTPTTGGGGSDEQFVERESALATLDGRLDEAVTGHGRLVWVVGEPGMGKTALVTSFIRNHARDIRVLTGSCDGLSTPRPLGPLVDMARDAADVASLLESGGGHDLMAGFLDLLSTPGRPTIAVFEDVHWADESTLDLIRHVGRRVEHSFALVLATYRPEELARTHPLRSLVADLATTRGVDRLVLEPLTVEGITRLAASRGLDRVDPVLVHQRTGGNPFFVTELLAHPTETIPDSVRDVVLARRDRLPDAAQHVLDVVAVVPGAIEVPLAEAIVGDDSHGIDTCVDAGVLAVREGRLLTFRHELARLAVADAIPPTRRRELNAAVCAVLLADDTPDPARVAHHAHEAGDGPTVLEYGLEAARRATEVGAHRQAAEQLQRALGYADALPALERAVMLTNYAREAGGIGDVTGAIAAAETAVHLLHDGGDVAALGEALVVLAECRFVAGRSETARDAAAEAVSLLEREGQSATLAEALASLARIRMLSRDHVAAKAHGARAIELAVRFDHPTALSKALNAVGSAEILTGELDQGEAHLREAVDVALAARDDAYVVLALLNLGSAFGEVREYGRAERYLREAITFATDRDRDQHRDYSTAWLARVTLETGQWDDARNIAASIADDRPEGAPPLPSIVAFTVLGRLRSRRGDPGTTQALERAWELASATGDLQRLWPAAAARAEAALLDGDAASVPGLVTETLELAQRIGHPWAIGELELMLQRSGHPAPHDDRAAMPYALHLEGRLEEAAHAWHALGCPYEEAMALADGDDDQVLRALAIFDRLGARRPAAALRQRMRDGGSRAVPRGPRSTTATHPEGLTIRQAEVLALVADGLTNAEIAHRLFISEKTAGHHVSAILTRLGVANRAEAARRYEQSVRPT